MYDDGVLYLRILGSWVDLGSLVVFLGVNGSKFDVFFMEVFWGLSFFFLIEYV